MPKFDLSTARVRFAAFELDAAGRQLLKRGIRIKLQDKPLDVLLALIEREGDFVTREELCRRIWPELPVAEAGRNLNKAVNKLRAALNDSSDSPRFIETLPRLGYRFVAPVEVLSPDEGGASPAGAAGQQAAPQEPAVAQTATRSPARRADGLRWWPAAAAAGLALGLLGAFSLARAPESPRITDVRPLTSDGRQKVGGLATDGRYIYFSEFRDGRVVPVQVPVSGGEPRIIEAPFDPLTSVFVLDVTRDGEQLLVKTGAGASPEETAGPLWTISPITGAARRLGDLEAHDARWSPDGLRLALIRGRELFVASGDGSDPRRRAIVGENSGDLVWSPDGMRLRFRSGFPGRADTRLWEVPVAGGTPQPVFPDWDYEQQFGEWPADGRFFIVYSPTDFRLWLAAEGWRWLAGGGVRRPLTVGPLRFRHARFGPEVSRLFVLGEIPRGELLRWDAQRGQFLPYRPGLVADQLDFSRDGRLVAYVSYPEGILWRSASDGSNRVQLTSAPMQVYLPRFSPDGRQIAFMGRLPHARWKIYLVPSEGGPLRQALPGEGPEADPNWSPDGGRLVFAPFPWQVAPEETGIRILDLATGELSSLADSQWLYSPRWSPDGRYIFMLHRDGTVRLYDLSRGAWVWSEPPPIQGGFPAWSRDSRFVYLFHAFTAERGIYRVAIPSGRVEKVASLLGIDVAGLLGPYGLSLAPDGSPIVLRDLSVQEIFTVDLD
jgi:DNA-binding winged helix-turn-helix (wHTH) protein/Tol biopolymer transport system component